MSRIITWEQIKEDFSSSYCDNIYEIVANEMIEDFLGLKPDGSMINLSTFKILLDNVLCIYDKDSIVFNKKDSENGNYRLEIEIIPIGKQRHAGS